MPKYRITRGSTVREVEAKDTHTARRMNADIWGDGATIETIAEVVPAGPTPDKAPEQKLWRVTWGELEGTVWAVSPDDAWAKFVGNNTNTDLWKYPKLHARYVEQIEATDSSPAKTDGGNKLIGAEDVDGGEHAPGTSPVADLHADEARDKISRMQSETKLKAIATHDGRSTIRDAANARLVDIGSNKPA